MNLGSVTLPSGFTLTESLASSLAPGESDTFTVQLDSSVVGTYTGEISFTTNDDDENPFSFQISGNVEAPSADIQLDIGWNLISLPLVLEDMNIETALNSISGKYDSIWNWKDGTWEHYYPDKPWLTTMDETVDTGRGYWLNMGESSTLSITGLIPKTPTVLSQGWNLVGYNSISEENITTVLSNIFEKVDSIWSWQDDIWKSYIPAESESASLTTLTPGFGYWINATEEVIWSLL